MVWTLASLRAEALQVLDWALAGAKRVGLVNFPNHGNPGDPLIWLGTETLLHKLGVDVIYRSAWWDFDPIAAKNALGNEAPLLLNGGGNLGDLYAGQQSARNLALAEMPGHRIIQMPQSIHFRDPANAQAFADLVRQHGNFELIVRERNSLKIAQEQLGINPLFSPDHALGSPDPYLWADVNHIIPAPSGVEAPLPAMRLVNHLLGGALSEAASPASAPDYFSDHTPQHDVLWLARNPGDPEHLEFWEPNADNVTRLEWLDNINTDDWDAVGRTALAINQAIREEWEPRNPWAGLLHRAAAATYDPLARRWAGRGYRILRDYRVVVTDKLHGHLMCVLAGIPHVVLDNSYGKVSGTLEAWTAELPGVHRTASGEEAWEIAQQLLRDLP